MFKFFKKIGQKQIRIIEQLWSDNETTYMVEWRYYPLDWVQKRFIPFETLEEAQKYVKKIISDWKCQSPHIVQKTVVYQYNHERK